MLHRESVSTFLSNVLDIIMGVKAAEDFRLVGGTALALQTGHRHSLDLDLFSDHYRKKYDFDELYRNIKKQLTTIAEIHLSDLTQSGVVLQCCSKEKKSECFKIDFWKWPNPFLYPPHVEGKIRMAGLADLAAMKFEAINDRSNYRDYVDIAFLSEMHTFSEMAELYRKRTLSRDYTRIITALSNPENLVKDQQLFFLNTISEEQLKEKVDYMLFVYTKEQEAKRKKK